MHLSQFVPPSPSPTVHTVCSLGLHIYCYPADRFISTIFLDSVYMRYYRIFVFLFLTSCSVASHVRLCDPMDCSTPGFPVLHCLSEFAQFMYIASVMLYNHFILCCPLLFWPSVFPSIRVFFNKSAFYISWPKYWSFSISPSNEYSGLIYLRMDCFGLFCSRDS